MGEQLHLLACRPVDPRDYPDDLYRLWVRTTEDVRARGGTEPPVYPGSVVRTCRGCGIRVAVGPLQQASLDVSQVMCLFCAAPYAAAQDAAVVDLGNPWRRGG